MNLPALKSKAILSVNSTSFKLQLISGSKCWTVYFWLSVVFRTSGAKGFALFYLPISDDRRLDENQINFNCVRCV